MKAAEIKELSVEDLKSKITEETKALGSLKLNHAVSPLENPLVIRSTKKLVARLKTALSLKEKA